MIKNGYKVIAGNIIFALNVFIIVLLLAGDHLSIPRWLQPIGRTHPLILHFPIVILLLAMMMEFFRFKAAFAIEKFYQEFADLLLFSGVIFSALTAIMGLFLAREPGYDGSDVAWHKWFGVSIVFVSSIIYWLRDQDWYNSAIARSGALITVFCLLIGGHYGASITHGDNFILAPVMQNKRPLVPIDQALVFRDVIQPIFENKCIGCHNPEKLKGGLELIDERSILKGGKSGKLFVPGQPALSLLLQRIHLPEEEKKHMPPSGKTQLTAAEMTVLYQWIKENADFKGKVTDLPLDDSLRLAAAAFLKPAETPEETYDFSAADEKLVKKLNNNYCGIYPIAEGSPALYVDIYNKNAYSPKLLEGLSGIRKQVVSLDVHKMPVKDAELKTIAQFENLRILNLNFTDITGSTLNNLASLKYLRSLSVAGVRLTPQAFAKLSAFKSLTELNIWNTGLTASEIQAIKNANKGIVFTEGFKDDGKPMKMVPPQIRNTKFVFSKPQPLILSNPIKGADIRYTTDGTDPDSVKSKLYQPGIMISDNITVKARAYKAGWYGSDIVSYSFYKNTYTPDSVSLVAAVNEKYQAYGAKTLTDGELGGMNFGNNKWLGTQNDLQVLLFFKNPVKPRAITINCLRVIGSQIFLPAEVEIWGGSDQAHLKRISGLKTVLATKDDKDMAMGVVSKLNGSTPVSCIKIIAKPIYKLPGWHPAKGKPSWIFADEVFIN